MSIKSVVYTTLLILSLFIISCSGGSGGVGSSDTAADIEDILVKDINLSDGRWVDTIDDSGSVDGLVDGGGDEGVGEDSELTYDVEDVRDNEVGDVTNDAEDAIVEDVSDGGSEVADIADVSDVEDVADVVPCDSDETATEPIPSRIETTEGNITVKYSFEGTQEYNICTHEVVSQNINSVLIEFTPPLVRGTDGFKKDGIPYINPSIEFFGERYIVQLIRPDPIDRSGKRLQTLLIKPASQYTEFDDCSGLTAKRHTLLDMNFVCNAVSRDKTMLDFINFANAQGAGLARGDVEGKTTTTSEPPVSLIAKLIDFKDNEDPKKVTYIVVAIENNYYYVTQNDMLRINCIKGDKCLSVPLPYQTMAVDGSEWKTDITAEEPNTEKCKSNTPCVSSMKFIRIK